MNASFNRDIQDALKQVKDLDLLEIPIEGVAAYWLSLKKVYKSKKTSRFIHEESEYTTEPFIKHLLEMILASFSDDQIKRLARIKKETITKDLQRKLILISIGVLGAVARENPQQVLIRIISKFPISPVVEQQIFQEAQDLIRQAERTDLLIDVDHRMHIDKLITHLIFYCMLSRRQGIEACAPFLKQIRSFYFLEGMNLIADGFDSDFIKHRLNLQKDEILYETRRKMDMSLEMCLGLRNNLSYEDMFKIANAFLL